MPERRPNHVRTQYAIRFEDIDDKALAMIELILQSTATSYTVSVEPGWPNLLRTA